MMLVLIKRSLILRYFNTKHRKKHLIANVFNPQISATSDMTLHYFGGDVNGFYFNYLASNTYQATTSFDGFTLISASGTITGTVRVYGVKN
jgi:hypothetical protein